MRLFATSEGLVSAPAPFTPAPADQERRGWLKKLGAALGLGLLAGPALAVAPRGTRQTTGVDPLLGEIMLCGFNFEVEGYFFCDGRLLPIRQYTALYALLGTTYGGDGTTTFALPDLRGRLPMGQGPGPGLSPHSIGERAGNENVTLTTAQMPAHNHPLGVSGNPATTATAAGNFPAAASGQTNGGEGLQLNSFGTTGGQLANGATIGNTGGSQPHSVMNPYLALNFQIAYQGYFPSRAY
ncbi:tail fiber protein [Hymenobacter sp. BT770]|uniref:phage tail protein n=1 Tax=Hymenobacter sp. BT770 TaxID=2886942 RepID=UPI001D0FE000|nr:tail fiber protein [Hymenobacter sp. BT770]MCC3155387.1 tail fiber protein [Hymenobacter sp. BT770]MDO3417436.1 tail fiber protein [Hymenobacter sp. BT770]